MTSAAASTDLSADTAVPPAPKAASPSTPMMVQYQGLKDQAGDCLLFYRMGDFFELFFDDARIAAAVLDIALTSRGESGGEKVPMCGVPVHAAEAYLARLIRAGHRVAIADQVETPAAARARDGSKALVRRAIVRVVTPGTVTEEALLDGSVANLLLAVAYSPADRVYGLAAADISTGRCILACAAPDALDAEVARIDPREIILPDGLDWPIAMGRDLVTVRPASDFSSVDGAARAAALFGVDWQAQQTGLTDNPRAAMAALAGLSACLDHNSQGAPLFLTAPDWQAADQVMAIDAATRGSLELTRTQTGERAGSLLATIDRTVTSGGARQLADDITAPLTDPGAIEARLALAQFFADDALGRTAVRDDLCALPDAARALGRLAAGRGSPRDLGQLRDCLAGAALLHDRLRRAPDQPPMLKALLPALVGHGALVDELSRALVPAPPTETAAGGFIADGYDAALDALRRTARDGRAAIAALESRYRDATGITALRVRHNGVLGYHIEVPARHADALMIPTSGFTHRQTLAGVVRFNAPDLHDAAAQVTAAGAHAIAAELAHLAGLTDQTLASRKAIAATCAALARVDVAAGLADLAMTEGWCRPVFADEPVLDITAGRHPVVAAALARSGDAFVANDARLTPDNRLWLITGPNMGGKSTFLRQCALIVILAQAGSFVPADAARNGIVDRLFSRVGASDNLARGQSTFMVEMVETAAILAGATARSFVILDEVGRGTSTYDGLALAWAVVEAVHDHNRCRCLFATHFHELTMLEERLGAISLHHVRAREWQGQLVLLHQLAAGGTDRSYGLAVAQLAGMPDAVVTRARAILSMLEAGRAASGGLAAGLADLPLFRAAASTPAPAPDPVRVALDAIDPDQMTPRTALEALYALKGVATRQDGP